jgi:GxxExxY protein
MEKIIPDVIKKVYDVLGTGYKEHIYQKAIEIEFQNENILFHSEVICPVNYKGIQIGFERADIVIYENSKPSCILELKSQLCSISKKELIQISKYFTSLDVSEGYIINFIINKHLEIYKVLVEFNNVNVFKYSFIEEKFSPHKL